ncbi:MAG: hypothetical protein H6729_09810 [Deltaproteobacteria bacterium]|nr:hypothetical protein [Deltaproteobacteria bacterium]
MLLTVALTLLWVGIPHSGAAPRPLTERLLSATTSCRAQFGDDVDEKPTEIRDFRHGYVHVAGSYPTCGCSCAATAAAFKRSNGTYRVLSFETWGCEWKSVLGGEWDAVLPANLRRELAPELEGYEGEALFILRAELPRRGTDVILTVDPIPLGMRLKCANGICISMSETEANTHYNDESEGDRRYALSRKLRYTRVVLKWDRVAGRFTIGDRTVAKKETRTEFLDRCGRWGAVC